MGYWAVSSFGAIRLRLGHLTPLSMDPGQLSLTTGLPPLAEGESALVLVDFQEGFLRENTAHLRESMQELVSSGAFTAIVATRFLNRAGSLWTDVLGWDGLMTVTEQALAVRLPSATPVIDKYGYGLPETAISNLAASFSKGDVYLAGIETDVCVSAIAAQLFDHGIPAMVLADYTASARGEPHQEHALVTLSRIVGRNRVLRGHFKIMDNFRRPADPKSATH